MGCDDLTSRARCCAAVDGRGGLYDQSPCVPAVGTFLSGSVCEAASWVRTNDARAAASCSELSDPTATSAYGAVAHHVQRVDVDLSTCAPADATACHGGALVFTSSADSRQVSVSVPHASSGPAASRLLSEASGYEVVAHRETSSDGDLVTWHLTYLSAAWATATLGVAATASGGTGTLPAVTSQTVVPGGLDIVPITGNLMNVPSASHVVSVRVARQTSSTCESPDWAGLRVGCFPVSALSIAPSHSATLAGELSLERCAHRCVGFPLFAVTPDDMCACLARGAGPDYEVQDGHCSASCSGSAAQLCGGHSNTFVAEADDDGDGGDGSAGVTAEPTASVFHTPPPPASASAACALQLMSAEAAPRLDAVHPTRTLRDGAVTLLTGSFPQLAHEGAVAPEVTICGIRCRVLSYNGTAVEAEAPACPAEPSTVQLRLLPDGYATATTAIAVRGELSVRGASSVLMERAAPLPTLEEVDVSSTSSPLSFAAVLNGSAAGGTIVHLHGSGFPTSRAAVSVQLIDDADGVTVLSACTVLASSASGLLCRTAAAADPVAAAGHTAALRVEVVDGGAGETPGAATAPTRFALLADSQVATISTVTSTAGSAAGGLVLCVGGTRLLDGGTPTILLGDTPCATLNATSVELCCRTQEHPSGAEVVAVQLHDPHRGYARPDGADLTFAYVTPPELLSLSPTTGHAGTLVTLSGSGLAFAQLLLADAPCSLVSSSDTSATCLVSDAAPGVATLSVTVPGVGTARVGAGVNFTYVIGFHSVEPAELSAGGGAPVVFRGGGFTSLPPPVRVTLGALPCAVTALSATEIVCTSSPLFVSHVNESALDSWGVTSEAAAVAVDGEDTCERWSAATCDLYRSATAACTGAVCALEYALSRTPTLLDVAPASGGVETTLTIRASGLSTTPALNTVVVGGRECAVQSAAAETDEPWASEGRQPVVRLECAVGPHEAGEHAVRVGLDGGHGYDVARQAFNFTHALNVLDFTPRAGSVAGGTTVTLSVDGFPSPEGVAFAEVELGGVPCRLTFTNHTAARCVTAAASAGTVALSARVRGRSGSTAECAAGCAFTYDAAATPTLSSASLDGLRLSLAGSGFATDGGASAHAVRVGGAVCAPVGSSPDGSSLQCDLAAPLPAGTHSVRLTRADWGDARSALPIRVTQSLALSGIEPSVSSLAGGQLVTLSGSGFGSAEETSVRMCGEPCRVIRTSPTEAVCATPAVAAAAEVAAAETTQCAVDVAVATAAQAESATCVGNGLDVVHESVLSTSCPSLQVVVHAAGATSRLEEHTCAVSLNQQVLELPSSGSASLCAVRLRNASLTVAQVECYGADEYDAAASLLGLVNDAEEGDLVLISTCGATTPWRSTNMALQKPLITLGSALARQGSDAGGWWAPSKGAHAYALIGRKSAGQLEAAEAEAYDERNVTVSATVLCDAGGVQSVLAHQRYGWGSPSHVAALVSEADRSGGAPLGASEGDAAPSDVFQHLRAIDLAATAASNANTATTSATRNVAGERGAWLASAAREAVVTVELASAARVEGVLLSTSADSVLVAAQDGVTGKWRNVAATLEASAPSVAFGPFGEHSLSLMFGAAVVARRLKIHYAARLGSGVLAARSLRVVGCMPAVTAQLADEMAFSSASTPRLLAVSPREGSARGGTDVTVRGSGFGGRDASQVTAIVAGVPCAVRSYADGSAQQVVVCTTGAHGGLQLGVPFSGAVELHVEGLGTAAPPAGGAASNSTTFEYLNLWSDPQTWGAHSLPVEGDTVFVPPGLSVLMDVSPPRLYFLVVQGHLTFARANLQLDASFIFVMGGSFTVGTEDDPFLHEAQITLHGSPVSAELPLYGAKVIACRRCTLDLHGRPALRTWTRLNFTAEAGATAMCFTQPVDWAVGSQLVITSTGFSMHEAEQRTMTSLSGDRRCVTFDTPLVHQHLGETRTYAGIPVELRAEVGLLSRNVVVQGDSLSPLDRHGGHVRLDRRSVEPTRRGSQAAPPPPQPPSSLTSPPPPSPPSSLLPCSRRTPCAPTLPTW